MKNQFIKPAVAAIMSALCTLSAFAYNPPFGGENLAEISSPELISGNASASGGPLFNVVPSSIAFNPAITAFEQRTVLNLSYTGVFDTNRPAADAPNYGQAFQGGVIVPTKYGVFSGALQGTFFDFDRMDLGNSLLIHLGAAKDVTDNLVVGMNLYSGFYFNNNSDFTVGCDLGFVYTMEELGFFKNVRIGGALLNLGKPLSGTYAVTGIDGTTTGAKYPGIITPRASFASDLFDVKNFKLAWSADVYAPSCQNLVVDAAVGMKLFNLVSINTGWGFNLREMFAGNGISWPGVSINLNFVINSSHLAMGNKAWEESEIVPSVAWKNYYDGLQAISGGASVYLGLADTSAPEIYLWDEVFAFDESEEGAE